MKAFLYSVTLQWCLDFRDKGIFLTYYVIPIAFFLFMSSIFTTIDPNASQTLIQSMTVFGVTMGAFLGTPTPLVELYNSEMRKAYKIGNIPLWTGVTNGFISGFIHLFLMSTIIFCLAPLFFQAVIPSNLFPYVISLTLFIITSLLIGILLGLTVKSSSKLTMFSQIVFLPSIMLSGIMFPVTMLPNPLYLLGKLFPATSGFSLMSASEWNSSSFATLIITNIIASLLCYWRLKSIYKME